MKTLRKPSEHDIQKAFCDYLDLTPYRHLYWAIPNGGKRSLYTGARMRDEGLRAGVPDMCIAVPTFTHHGMFIEFKSLRGKLSDPQKEWIARLTEQGYYCCVCRSLEEAIAELKGYIG